MDLRRTRNLSKCQGGTGSTIGRLAFEREVEVSGSTMQVSVAQCDGRLDNRLPDSCSRLPRFTHCPRMRPRKRGPLPIVGSLILPMVAMRSSAMRSAAL